MGSLFGGRRSGKGKVENRPRYATRQEVIDLFMKYYHEMPTEEGIRANMGNPGGVTAIERMLLDSLKGTDTTEPIPNTDIEIPPNPPEPNQPITIDPLPIDGQVRGIHSDASDNSIRYFRQSLPEIGPFVFNGYNTRACRLTNQGNVNYIGYSYWRNINNHVGSDSFKVLLSINEELQVLTVNKNTLTVESIIGLGIHHTGEGCFFSAHFPDDIYYTWGSRFIRRNIISGVETTVIQLNGNEIVWQCHANYDEDIFSCSVKDSNSYQITSWLITGRYRENKRFPLKGAPDECQIDKSGKFLVTKEDNFMRVINIDSDEEFIIDNEGGALGHSDNGYACAIGEDDYNLLPSALVHWDFLTHTKKVLHHTDYWNLGHISFTNCQPVPLEQQYCLISGSGNQESIGRELTLVKLDGSMRRLIIAPALTESYDYMNMPMANLCPHGRYAIWTCLVGGRRDAFIVEVPQFN